MLVAAVFMAGALLLMYVLLTNHYGTTGTVFTLILRGYQIIFLLGFIPVIVNLLRSGNVYYMFGAAIIFVIFLLYVEYEALAGTQYSLRNVG